MVGTIIGAGIGLGSSIYAGVKSAEENKKYRNALAEVQKGAQQRVNDAEAEKNYWKYVDPSQTVRAQAGLNNAREAFTDYIGTQESKDAIMGTNSTGAAKQQALKALGSATSKAVSDADDARISQEQFYAGQQENAQSRADKFAMEQAKAYQEQAKNIAAAGAQASKIGGNLMDLDVKSKLATGKGLFENW